VARVVTVVVISWEVPGKGSVIGAAAGSTRWEAKNEGGFCVKELRALVAWNEQGEYWGAR